MTISDIQIWVKRLRYIDGTFSMGLPDRYDYRTEYCRIYQAITLAMEADPSLRLRLKLVDPSAERYYAVEATYSKDYYSAN